MPTFQSIGIHPELRSRLVTERRGQEGGDQQPVETPQALLSRHPTSLRLLDRQTGTSKAISLSKATKLREDVAHALIARSNFGKYVRSVQDVVRENDQGEKEVFESDSSINIDGCLSSLDLVRFELFKQQKCVFPCLSTGSSALDQMLALPPEYTAISTQINIGTGETSYGLPFGHVTQFSGPPASGKTQLALQLAASPLCIQCWYLCSNAAIRSYVQRLLRLMQSSSNQKEILDGIKFCTVTDEYQLLACLADVEASLRQRNQVSMQGDSNDSTQDYVCTPTLLILDSASGCLSSENDVLLQKVSSTIKRMARQFSVAVVVANGSVTKSDAEPNARQSKPALGRSWKAAADIHVWLEALAPRSSDGSMVVQAKLDKHPAKSCSEDDSSPLVSSFLISASGIRDVSSV